MPQIYCNKQPIAYISRGYHRHSCTKCKTVWEHPNEAHGNDEAHKCPKCGKQEWTQYFGKSRTCYTQEIVSETQVINHLIGK